MSELKRQARRLADLYTELEEKETWFEFNDLGNWCDVTCRTPHMRSDLSLWRVAEPKRKIIDLSLMVGSDIDMEFPTNAGTSWFTSQLKEIKEGKFYISKHNYKYSECRIRQNHWHHLGGGECPLPRGLTGQVLLRNRNVIILDCASKWVHDEYDMYLDIIAFMVTGVTNDYKYEWEK